MADPYRTLRIMPSASLEQIDTAYARERARLDGGDAREEDAGARQAALDDAYALLHDPARRAAYDRQIVRAPQPVTAEIPLVDDGPPGAPPPATTAPAALAPAAANLAYALAPLTAVAAPPSAPAAQRACPHCGALNPSQVVTCSACGRQMTRPCPNCGQPVALGQVLCERCQAPVLEYDQRRYADALVADQQISQARQELAANVEALEATNEQRFTHAVVFWLVALALAVGIVLVLVLANQPHP